MILDAHQHFWNYDPVSHAWINDEMAGIRRSFGPQDLIKELQENNVDGCIAVQADQTLAENEYLLNLASENHFIKGVVGWVDMRSEAVENELSRYSQNPKMKGFRHIVQGEADHNFLLRPDFLRGISKLESYGFTYDILVFPHQLGAVLEFVKKFPNQKFVIDHMAKPYIKDGFYDGWASLMSEIAKHENVYCKVSGMVTEAHFKLWKPTDFTPYLDHVLYSFGSERLLFGTDWPVCLVAATYGEVKSITEHFITSLSNAEQAAIMGLNAEKFYNI